MLMGLRCPRCKSPNQISEYADEDLYVCEDCGFVIGYLCPGCNRLMTCNNLKLNVYHYRCKFCGEIQFGYDEYKRRNP